MNIILNAGIVMGVSGLLLGLCIAAVSSLFHVDVDEKSKEIRSVLPGANCGGCGFVGCDSYAKAISEDKTDINLCLVGGADLVRNLSRIVGKEVEIDETRYVAKVVCQGSSQNCKTKFNYEGLEDCWAAITVSDGDKSCEYACVGLGSCVSVCEYNAISIVDSVAKIDPLKCVSCQKCLAQCPKKVIKILPEKSFVEVACSSKDRGKSVMNVCSVGCYACGKCARVCPDEAISLDENKRSHKNPIQHMHIHMIYPHR